MDTGKVLAQEKGIDMSRILILLASVFEIEIDGNVIEIYFDISSFY